MNRPASLKQEITQDKEPACRPGRLLDEGEAVKGIETEDTGNSKEKGPGMEVHHLNSKVLMSPSPSQCQREFAGGEKSAPKPPTMGAIAAKVDVITLLAAR